MHRKSFEAAHSQFAFRKLGQRHASKFCVGVDCRPRPNITRTFRLHFRRAVLFLGVAIRPYLIDLDSLAVKIPKNLVLIGRARIASVDQKFHDRIDGGIGQTRGGPNRNPFAKTMENPRPLVRFQSIHNDIYA